MTENTPPAVDTHSEETLHGNREKILKRKCVKVKKSEILCSNEMSIMDRLSFKRKFYFVDE